MSPWAVRGAGVLHLLAIGEVRPGLLGPLARGLEREFGCDCQVLPGTLSPENAFHAGRMQYYSTALLAALAARADHSAWRLLGVTEGDLYIPILTFVFGEAQLDGRAAVVSTFRLRQEFYGLPADDALLHQRLLKEAVHELGHTLALAHCEDYRCAMAAAHGVEGIDLKSSGLCSYCQNRAYAAAL